MSWWVEIHSAAAVSPHPEAVMLRTAILAASLFLPLAACGGDDPTGPESGPMTALMNGERFVAEFATVQGSANQVFVNGAGAGGRAIGFTIPDSGPGTYELGVGNPVAVGVQVGSATWTGGAGAGSGSITVTTFTETRIAGTFAFVVGNGGGAEMAITEGEYDIEYGAS